MAAPYYTTCPSTGERVTLTEIAKRHGLSRGTVRHRYAIGKRGDELIAPARQGEQNKQQREMDAQIERAARTPLAQPMHLVARASNIPAEDTK